MTKILYFLCFIALGVVLVGCNKDSLKLGSKSNYEIDNRLVNMAINKESITNTSAEIYLINNAEKNYQYGAEFWIEYQKKGAWYMIIPKDEMNFNMIAYLLEDNTSKDFNINWENFYGKLPKGKYRIVKSLFPEDNKSEDIYVAVEFVIE